MTKLQRTRKRKTKPHLQKLSLLMKRKLRKTRRPLALKKSRQTRRRRKKRKNQKRRSLRLLLLVPLLELPQELLAVLPLGLLVVLPQVVTPLNQLPLHKLKPLLNHRHQLPSSHCHSPLHKLKLIPNHRPSHRLNHK